MTPTNGSLHIHLQGKPLSWKWLLLGLPAAGGLRFVDPRAAAVVGLVTVLSVFLAVVFNSDPS